MSHSFSTAVIVGILIAIADIVVFHDLTKPLMILGLLLISGIIRKVKSNYAKSEEERKIYELRRHRKKSRSV